MDTHALLAGFDPAQHSVGTLALSHRKLGNGLHAVAHDPKTNVTLWAKMHHGEPVCFRAVDGAEQLLETVSIFRPEPHAQAAAVKGAPPPHSAFMLMDNPDGGTDGGTSGPHNPNCPWICAALGDGGMICWRAC